MTLLVSLFITSRNLLLIVFLPKNIITILQKVAIHFWQVSLKGVLSAKSFKSNCEKVTSLKKFKTHELPYKWF